mmetsp:Transcript_105684/g.340685  ORF Transcript_105684/g.340685 Transcript_105684/m.340685 type:complete len:859 (-) Transcript_105684:84-2660(-)
MRPAASSSPHSGRNAAAGLGVASHRSLAVFTLSLALAAAIRKCRVGSDWEALAYPGSSHAFAEWCLNTGARYAGRSKWQGSQLPADAGKGSQLRRQVVGSVRGGARSRASSQLGRHSSLEMDVGRVDSRADVLLLPGALSRLAALARRAGGAVPRGGTLRAEFWMLFPQPRPVPAPALVENSRDILRDGTPEVFIKDHKIRVSSRFDQRAVKALRSIDGHRWDPDAKNYEFPLECAPRIVALCEHMGCQVDLSLKAFAAEVDWVIPPGLSVKDIYKSRPMHAQMFVELDLHDAASLGTCSIRSPYNKVLIEAMKRLPGHMRLWDPEARVWRVHMLAMPKLIESLRAVGFVPSESFDDACRELLSLAPLSQRMMPWERLRTALSVVCAVAAAAVSLTRRACRSLRGRLRWCVGSKQQRQDPVTGDKENKPIGDRFYDFSCVLNNLAQRVRRQATIVSEGRVSWPGAVVPVQPPILRLRCSELAVISGIFTNGIGRSFMEALYQDLPELKAADEAIVGKQLGLQELLEKSGQADALREIIASSASTRDVEGPRAAKRAAVELIHTERALSDDMTSAEVTSLWFEVSQAIAGEYGNEMEQSGLDDYATWSKRKLYGHQRFARIGLPQEGPEAAARSSFPKLGKQCISELGAAGQVAGAPASPVSEEGAGRKPYLFISGHVDALADVPRAHPAAPTAGGELEDRETVVVEMKNRFTTSSYTKDTLIQRLGPVLQVCSYCRLMGLTRGELVDYTRQESSEGGATEMKVIDIDMSERSTARELWDNHVLPRMYEFAQVIYHVRADDDLRRKVLSLSSNTIELQKLVFELCPYLLKRKLGGVIPAVLDSLVLRMLQREPATETKS